MATALLREGEIMTQKGLQTALSLACEPPFNRVFVLCLIGGHLVIIPGVGPWGGGCSRPLTSLPVCSHPQACLLDQLEQKMAF